MSKLPGVGFRPEFFGGRTARYRHNGVWMEGPFDPSARPFGPGGGGPADGSSTPMDPVLAAKRWGGYTPGDDLQGRGAERQFGVGNILNEAFKQGRPGLGTPETHTGIATWEESYDRSLLFAKGEAPFLDLDNNPNEGGGMTPGQPAITAISSPEPGVIELSWRTRAGHTRFIVSFKREGAGLPSFSGLANVPVTDPTATTFSHRIENVEDGEIVVAVTAYIGGTAGKPSLPKTVSVIAAADKPPVVDPPKLPPPPPPPAPTTKPNLSEASRATIADVRARIAAGKNVGAPLQARLVALFNELEGK